MQMAFRRSDIDRFASNHLNLLARRTLIARATKNSPRSQTRIRGCWWINYFEGAENYGATRFKVLTRVVIPDSLPLVLTGARLALNIALLLTIAVELVSAPRGLGEMICMVWQTLRGGELCASLAVIGALGMVFNLVLQLLGRRLVPRHAEREV
jgi:ABC-type antimicrobial peptide transport system permease subunit